MPMAVYVLLLVVFFTSGFCALVYEVAWTRILDHVFGISVFATTTVLATFMAGLAIGALLAGRRADAAEEPLRGYAVIELGIAICAFVTPFVFVQLEPAYGWFFRALEGHPVLLTAARATLAFAALIVPASLLGATFPFMTRSLVRSGVTAGRDIGLLYGMNTLGGVCGCLAAGFVLLAHLGTARTIYVAGVFNLAIAAMGLTLARRVSVRLVTGRLATSDAVSADQLRLTGTATALLMIAIFWSGFTSLAYEVVWFRGMLAYVFNSTYAFSLMLATFLLGIGIGGILYGGLPPRMRESVGFVGILTVMVGASSWVAGLLFPNLNRYAYRILDLRLIESWGMGLALIAVECSLILLVPATLLGLAFPASLHLLTRAAPAFGMRIGRLYSLNTVGGIAGSLAAGFLMIPILGMRNSLLLLIATQLLLGLALVREGRNRVVTVIAVSAIGFIGFVVPFPPARMFLDALNLFPSLTRIIFYKEGITDNTAVSENIKTGDRVVLYSDARGTAGTGMARVQKFFGHLPMLLHPAPKDVLNICFGVGNSMSAMIKHDPERLDSVELSPHVRLTAPFFWTNDGVLDDPRVRTVLEDGSTYVRYTDQRYDVISLEPPELHTAGVVNLYTREFYEASKRILKPGGLMEQWFPASEIPEPELKMLMRTFMTVFPYTVVFTELESTVFVTVGSTSPIALDLDVIGSWFQRPKVAEHLRYVGIDSPAALLAFFVAGQDHFWEYVGRDGPIVTDDRTWVDFMAPRSGASGFGFGLFKYPKPLDAYYRRVQDDWATIDSLRQRDPVSNWLQAAGGVGPSLRTEIEAQRARRRRLRRSG